MNKGEVINDTTLITILDKLLVKMDRLELAIKNCHTPSRLAQLENQWNRFNSKLTTLEKLIEISKSPNSPKKTKP